MPERKLCQPVLCQHDLPKKRIKRGLAKAKIAEIKSLLPNQRNTHGRNASPESIVTLTEDIKPKTEKKKKLQA